VRHFRAVKRFTDVIDIVSNSRTCPFWVVKSLS